MNKRRILVVDDEASFTRLLKLNLEQTDAYEVRVETGPDRAVRAAREFGPDLILMDIIMPGMFGHEVASQFAADAQLRTVPVVYLSAAPAGKPPEATWPEWHGRPLIPKPASVDQIIESIEFHLCRPSSAPGGIWSTGTPT